MKRTILLLILAASALVQAGAQVAPVSLMPNAMAACQEGCSIKAMPVETVYQLGAGAGSAYTD